MLAAISVLGSEMPGRFAWLVAMASVGFGMWRARSEARRRPQVFWFPGNGHPPTVDGRPMVDARLHWRGSLAFLRWRDCAGGRWRHVVWWPDTLPAARRRELRLAAGDGDAGRHRRDRAP